MAKKDMDKLDEMNLLWVFKQISVGNLVRLGENIGKALKKGKDCLVNAADAAEECCAEKPKKKGAKAESKAETKAEAKAEAKAESEEKTEK